MHLPTCLEAVLRSLTCPPCRPSVFFPPPAQEHTADLKQRIEAQFSDLHQFLYQEEKLLQVKLKTEERRELIRLDEHKALLCVEISRLQRAVQEIEEKLREQDPFTLLRVSFASRPPPPTPARGATSSTTNAVQLDAAERPRVSQSRG